MASFYTILTSIGQAKVANAVALGQKVNLSTLAVGDANGVTPQPDASAKALVHERRRAPLNRVEVDRDNPNFIVCEQVLPPEVGGWEIREIGVFDDEGNLIAYGNYPPTYKPLLNEGTSRTQAVRMVMQVSDTAAVTLKVDPSIVLATRQYVDDKEAVLKNITDEIKKALGSLKDEAILKKATALLDSIELYGKTGFIDWHFDGSEEDYTTRLIERAKGILSCIGDFEITGALKLDGVEVKHIYTEEQSSYDTLPTGTDTLITAGVVREVIKRLDSKLHTFDGVKGATGWKQYPDGSIEQWGVSPQTGDKKWVPFPISFPNECFCVIVCEGTSSGAGTGAIHVVGVEQNTITREGFRQRVSDQSEDVRYLAKGW